MKHRIDIATWPRKDHFQFFSPFDEPFFGVCVEIDCTRAYEMAKDLGCSFFLYYLYKSLVAANYVEPFRYRILDGEVWEYDQVNASPTINRPDGTFGYGYMNYESDFSVFLVNAQIEIDRIQNSKGLEPAICGENVIHYSSLPWIKFTSVSHARRFTSKDSIPKITFGQMTQQNDRRIMPVSIHVHHALMDGWDVGHYLDHFRVLMEHG